MTRKKQLVASIIVAIFIMVFLYINTYTSSPGFTSEQYREEFYANKPTCYGIDILLNKKATWSDTPGRSVCIGYLK